VPPARAVSVPPRRLAPEADSATPAVEGVVAAITRLADDGRLAEAVQAGEAASIGPEATAELFALLGTSYAALGDATRAERCYRRALYLDPEYVESLMHLALLLEAGGSAADAARLRARARRTSAREPGGSA
ncbi:MAG: chemotaxis protein CheR, partial [Gemmatimonadetes bacterium]|nr:chemotaxis protein CheR [Gemmatimonadota bacterium]